MRIPLLFIAALLAISAPAHEDSKRSDGSEFKLDKGLLDNLYRSATTEASVDTERYSAGLEISPLVSFVRPLELTLANAYYRSSTTAGLPLLQVQLSRLLGYSGGFLFYGYFRGGYGYRQGITDVQAVHDAVPAEGQSSQDIVKLHWIPVSLGLRTVYEIPGVSWFKPSLAVGGGVEYLSRSGKLDGMDQSFWIPHFFGTAAVTLFDRSHRQGEWFGGVTVGLTYQNSIASAQKVRFLSWDLGATFIL